MIKNVLISLIALTLLNFNAPLEAQGITRPDLLYCGGTSRSGPDLYDIPGTLNEISSCAPDSDTQAMLVSRSGTYAGNGAAWLSYLNNGGIIITEWRNAADVYNEIYGTAYSEGSGFGDCWDNPMPSLKLNTDHPFWLANDIEETPAEFEGCGADLANLVAGEAEVTALGGLVGTSVVSFAIREQGLGIFYILEADWQDNEENYTQGSREFMAALIGSQGQPTVPVPVNSTVALWLLVFLVAGFAAVRLRARSAS